MRLTSITKKMFLLLLSLTVPFIGDQPRGASFRAAPPWRMMGSIQLHACNLPDYGQDALCWNYEVFEDRKARSGLKIALTIIVLPALTQKTAPDPVFFLTGGPGMGASMMTMFDGGPWKALRRERDVIYSDQHGTGDSNPLRCDLIGNTANIQRYFNELSPIDKIRACRDKHARIANLKLYTTPINTDDLDEVREAFGYSKINQYGESYGTLAALEYLRQHAKHGRSTVLAGVATPAFKLPLNFVHHAQLALDRLIEVCSTDKSRNGTFPNLIGEFASVFAQLNAASVSFSVSHPTSKLHQKVTMSRGVFVERLRLMLYDLDDASFVPIFVHSTAQIDWGPFGAAAANAASRAPNILATGMYLTVTCSEFAWRITEPEIARETKNAFTGEYRIRMHLRACMDWPRGTISTAYYEPEKADALVLMFSGDLDAATQPQFGQAAAMHLPNSRQVLIRNASHNYLSECFQNIAANFFAEGLAKGRDPSCVDGLRRPPFVTELSPPPSKEHGGIRE
jgi:pimeloyl-ACP methyl ester carboxylesterase